MSRYRIVSGLGIGFLYATLFTGCARFLPAPTPMRTITNLAREDHQSRCLLIFMPGLGDSDEDFVDHGFIDAVRARNLPVDVIATNATIGYYARRTLLDRIRPDVIDPARAAGYEQIWLAGISMGGVGALLVAKDQREHGHDLTGLILMAPYLGGEEVQKEIHKAGGLAKWEAGPKTEKEDYDRDLWRFLQQATDKQGGAPSIYLGAGDDDRLQYGHKLLADRLPQSHVYGTPGGHDWGPWGYIWADFLDHSELRERCKPIPH
jgi:pimeloyl-ACP methyl ester carboxylesterase